MDSQMKQKWIDALRSGDYEQGKGALRSKSNYYCCLGVLCDIVEDGRWQLEQENYSFLFDGTGSAGTLPRALANQLGIETDEIGKVTDTLINMNDGRHEYFGDEQTFNQIADWIEENL